MKDSRWKWEPSQARQSSGKREIELAGTHTITGEIEFQVCDDVTCLPPKMVEFSFMVTLGEAEVNRCWTTAAKGTAGTVGTGAGTGADCSGLIDPVKPLETQRK